MDSRSLYETYFFDEDELRLQQALFAQYEKEIAEKEKAQPSEKNETTIANQPFVLPPEFELGTVTDDGGCFFSALAKALDNLGNKTYNEKALREACHRYYYKHKEEIDNGNLSEYGGIESEENYSFVQYTTEELNEFFNHRPPIWGRPEIEGIMLCRELPLESICILEMLESPDSKEKIASFSLVTANKVKTLEAEDGNKVIQARTCPVLFVDRNHFSPVLSKEKEVELKAVNETKVLASQVGLFSYNSLRSSAPAVMNHAPQPQENNSVFNSIRLPIS